MLTGCLSSVGKTAGLYSFWTFIGHNIFLKILQSLALVRLGGLSTHASKAVSD